MKYLAILIAAMLNVLMSCGSADQPEAIATPPEAAAPASATPPGSSTPAAAAPAESLTPAVTTAATADKVDGSAIYVNNCQMCHQATGTGLPGAFPTLKGSPKVNDANSTQLVTIILQGYNARPEYGVMPGYAAALNDDKVAAVATYVRGAWGNNGGPVTAGFVRKLRAATAK